MTGPRQRRAEGRSRAERRRPGKGTALPVPADEGSGIVLAPGFDRGRDEAPGALRDRWAAAKPTDRDVVDHAMNAVGAEDQPLLRQQLSRPEHVHERLGLRPDASGQDVSVGSGARLGGRDLARGNARGHDRVIVGDLPSLATGHDVGPRVADVGDADHALRI